MDTITYEIGRVAMVLGFGMIFMIGCGQVCAWYDRRMTKARGLTYADLAHAKERMEYTESTRPRLIVKGVPQDLEFTLINLDDHLRNGGFVRMEFNADGTHMTVSKVFPAPHSPVDLNGSGRFG